MTNHYTDVCEATIESLRQQLASTEANQANIEATHRITLRDVQRETMRVQTENDTLRQQLAAALAAIKIKNHTLEWLSVKSHTRLQRLRATQALAIQPSTSPTATPKGLK